VENEACGWWSGSEDEFGVCRGMIGEFLLSLLLLLILGVGVDGGGGGVGAVDVVMVFFYWNKL